MKRDRFAPSRLTCAAARAKKRIKGFFGTAEPVSGLFALAKPRRIKASHRRRRKVASGQSVQRYYDPAIGRFLSVDPVTAYSNPLGAFNRYWYANNNPYAFTDPDGRAVERVKDGKIEGADTVVDLKPVVVRPERTTTDAIVMHRTVSSSADSAVNSAVANGGKASFHIVIGADGSTTQIANLNNVANHVGKPTGDVSNQNSIGIEVVGNYNASNGTWDALTPAQVEATAQAVYVIGKAYGVSSSAVFPHESVSRKTAGEGSTVINAISGRLDQLYRQGPPPFDSYLQGAGQ